VTDLQAYLDGRPISARPVGTGERAWKWVKRNPGRAGILACAVLAILAAGVAASEVRRQREADRLAAERQLAEATRQKERETRAAALVDALNGTETPLVPRIVADLSDLRDLARAKLLALAAQPVNTKPGLHARLALLHDEPHHAAELAAYLPASRPDELLTIRELLKPHGGEVGESLWAVLTDAKADSGRRVRAACALAGLTPDDARWIEVAPVVTEFVVKENPLQAAVWVRALEPIRGPLLPALMKRYPEARQKIESGKLAASELAAEATAFDLTANLLARFAVDQPAELAELAVTADARHYALFADAIRTNRAAIVTLLKAELRRPAPPAWAVDGRGSALAAVGGGAAFADWLELDRRLLERARRTGHIVAVLVALGESESTWSAFAFPANGDPTARSYLLARLAGIGADPRNLMWRFEEEPDASAKRALVLALGDFSPRVVPVAERETFTRRLLVVYREHSDSGLHSAIDWLLRRKWGRGEELAAIDAELTRTARAKVLAQALAAVWPLPVTAFLLAAVTTGKDWFVNSEGQTFAVVRGPVEFAMGSPASEPGRIELNELPHPKKIGRTFAMATKEVTVEQFLRFRPNHAWLKRFSPGPDTPAVSISWYDCAAYCNWLSEREGIPPDQWCYEPNEDGRFAEGMRIRPGHLGLTGYRLPTEAEWEFACRAGATTSRSYGRGDELLPRYGWFLKTADDRSWPVGWWRPNERGLFDCLGNALEWCEGPAMLYLTATRNDVESLNHMLLAERTLRVVRGGSFLDQPFVLRSAFRSSYRPGFHAYTLSFRPARTLNG
jgi:formylglycine-generating enzyme required for sulfatase activity